MGICELASFLRHRKVLFLEIVLHVVGLGSFPHQNCNHQLPLNEAQEIQIFIE